MTAGLSDGARTGGFVLRPQSPLRWYLIAAAVIAAAVVGVYWNTLDNEFLTFDDRKYIYENELVTGDGGLAAIWGDIRNDNPALHYRPLTFTTLWIEHALVGLEPRDTEGQQFVNRPAHPLYHWTQMGWHAINAILVLLVLRSLGFSFPAALFAAAFFALHPVNVASVTWMAERKNVVSGAFFWLALLFYIRHRRRGLPSASGRIPWLYLAAVAAFALALTAKVAAIVLVPILIVTDRLLDRRWSWSALLRAVPFGALGLIAAYITAAREASIARSWDPVDLWLRPFIAVSALVHYVVKMFLPVRQAIIYPRWAESLLEPRYWISLVVVAVAVILMWRWRRWLGDQWFWALAVFLLSVAPVLGLKYFLWMQFAFVSDHYMYTGSVGVLLLVGLLLSRWCLEDPGRDGGVGASGSAYHRGRLVVAGALSLVALVGCGVRTVEQNRTWKNNVTLWTHTLAISPDCVVANLNLARHHSRTGDHERALEHYLDTARIRPDYVRAWRSSAREARRLNRVNEATGYYVRAIAVAETKDPGAWKVRLEYADYLRRLGRLQQALAQYEAVLAKGPSEAADIETTARQIREKLTTPNP